MILAERSSRWFTILLELSKFRIALFVSLSAFTGFVLANGQLSFAFLLPTIAVFILASGSAALNHYQERDFDFMMKRTRRRPVPSKRITAAGALSLSMGLILTGLVALYLSSNTLAMILGLVTVLWYNAVYTPLKRMTPLAVIPGALIGALPPAIGWTAAGGALFDPFLLIIILFFFIWQIPHFWLLLLKFGEEYEEAGYPTLTSKYSNKQIAKFTFFWIIATVIISMIIPVLGFDSSMFLYIGLFFCAVWLLLVSRKLLVFNEDTVLLKKTFININTYILLVMCLLTVDRLLKIGV